MTMGYALPNSTYPNPIDYVLVKLQTIYPLDYVAIIIFAFVLVMYTISGYMSLGIRFFFFKVRNDLLLFSYLNFLLNGHRFTR